MQTYMQTIIYFRIAICPEVKKKGVMIKNYIILCLCYGKKWLSRSRLCKKQLSFIKIRPYSYEKCRRFCVVILLKTLAHSIIQRNCLYVNLFNWDVRDHTIICFSLTSYVCVFTFVVKSNIFSVFFLEDSGA